ncbi:MAG: phosphoribulokinase [Archaeoglobus sp.]|nr:phosphoribulokinase [Archaeoglobus sp.]
MAFLVGVAGDSASGKTTFAKGVVRLFGEEKVLSISLDNYHRYDREERKRLKFTPLHPEANDFKRIFEDLSALKEGKSIRMPVYDHSTGRFVEPVEVKPKEIVIVEGLHPFYRKKIADLFDFKIFIDPEFEVRKEWKIKRDVGERGYSLDEVLKEMELRKVDYKKYVEPQKRRAEVIVKIRKDKSKKEYQKGSPYWIRILQLLTGEKLSTVHFPLNLSSMVEAEADEFYFEYRKIRRGKKLYSLIEFNGIIERETLSELERAISAVVGGGEILEGEKVNEVDVAKLIIAWRVAERYKSKSSREKEVSSDLPQIS